MLYNIAVIPHFVSRRTDTGTRVQCNNGCIVLCGAEDSDHLPRSEVLSRTLNQSTFVDERKVSRRFVIKGVLDASRVNYSI